MELKLPSPESTYGEFVVVPIDFWLIPGWSCSRAAKFRKELNIYRDPEGKEYRWQTWVLTEITEDGARPRSFVGVCVCSECIKVHRDKKMHFKKKKILYKEKMKR